MPTPTRTGRTATTRTGRSATAGQSRFPRTSSTSRGMQSSSRTPGLRRRKQAQPTGVKKVLSAVLPTGAAKKATPSSKKGKAGAGGLALAAAAAGMAFKNRGKISQLRNKTTGTDTGTSYDMTPATGTGANNSPMPPTTPTP